MGGYDYSATYPSLKGECSIQYTYGIMPLCLHAVYSLCLLFCMPEVWKCILGVFAGVSYRVWSREYFIRLNLENLS
jgi:hypothetical protein